MDTLFDAANRWMYSPVQIVLRPTGRRRRLAPASVSSDSLAGTGHNWQKLRGASSAFREAVELRRTLGQENEDVATDLNALVGAEHDSGELRRCRATLQRSFADRTNDRFLLRCSHLHRQFSWTGD